MSTNRHAVCTGCGSTNRLPPNAAQAHHAAADADGDGKVMPWEHRRQN